MIQMKHFLGKALLLAAVSMFSVAGASCSGSSDNSTATTGGGSSSGGTSGGGSSSGGSETSTFAKGADVSWLTEMEKDNKKFYDSKGNATECLSLLKSLGTNAIRLRVWVNPDGGWCGKDDVVAKAVRAQQLGMRIMIDFHYSDIWADPNRQTVPAAWENYTFEQMKQAVTNHTNDVLSALKAKGVDVEWVQVGNETPDGMLWGKNTGTVDNPKWGNESADVSGRCSKNPSNFAAYVNAGYDAVKAVYPKAKVVVHVDQGQNLNRFTWLFGQLKSKGGKWDVIGMSLYPEDSSWQSDVTSCLNNINTLSKQYGCNVVISEVGMEYSSANASSFMKKMVDGCKAISTCEGIFYWEPEVYGGWKPANYTSLGWNAYTKGAFDNLGKPTSVFDAYK